MVPVRGWPFPFLSSASLLPTSLDRITSAAYVEARRVRKRRYTQFLHTAQARLARATKGWVVKDPLQHEQLEVTSAGGWRERVRRKGKSTGDEKSSSGTEVTFRPKHEPF